ncbi:MAG: glucose-6-phosphate dehydrogenase, partial [Anaerolineae bacterium]|nr:glucose-6-phosphate dehydrogenase [Anaerolineae bacterium]
MSDSTTILIFGASGDLTRRKLVPALYNLYCKERLPDSFQVVGNSRTKYSHEDWRKRLREGVEEFSGISFNEDEWNAFSEHLWYVPGSANEIDDLKEIDQFIQEKEEGKAHRLYYLSVAPDLYI